VIIGAPFSCTEQMIQGDRCHERDATSDTTGCLSDLNVKYVVHGTAYEPWQQVHYAADDPYKV
jgi:hypothetical protein